jgi:hypothetical protein
MAKEIQAKPEEKEVVDHVHENGVDRRASRSAYASSSDPEKERIG